MKKIEPFHTIGGNVNWYFHYAEKYGGFSERLKIELPCDPTVPLQGIYPKKTPIICKNICTPMFITTRFIIDKTWKQPKCISKSGLRRYSTSYNGILFSHKKSKIMKFKATR